MRSRPDNDATPQEPCAMPALQRDDTPFLHGEAARSQQNPQQPPRRSRRVTSTPPAADNNRHQHSIIQAAKPAHRLPAAPPHGPTRLPPLFRSRRARAQTAQARAFCGVAAQRPCRARAPRRAAPAPARLAPAWRAPQAAGTGRAPRCPPAQRECASMQPSTAVVRGAPRTAPSTPTGLSATRATHATGRSSSGTTPRRRLGSDERERGAALRALGDAGSRGAACGRLLGRGSGGSGGNSGRGAGWRRA